MTEHTISYLPHDLGSRDSWGQPRPARRREPAVTHPHTDFPGPDYVIHRKCAVRVCPEGGWRVNLNAESTLNVSFLIRTLQCLLNLTW